MEDTSSTGHATTCRSSVVVNAASITTAVDDTVPTKSSEYSLEDTSFSNSLSTTSSSTLLPTALPMSSTTVTVTQSSPSSQLSSSLPRDIAKNKFVKPVQPEGITFPFWMFGSSK